MDVERHKEQADQTGAEPRFVWELERGHTQAPSKQPKTAGTPGLATPAKPVRPAAKPAQQKPARPQRPRRRRALLSVFVTIAVFGAGAFAATQLIGRGDTSKTTSSQAAELGSAEFPASTPSLTDLGSTATRTPATPTRRPSASPSPTHHTPTPSASASASASPKPTKPVEPVEAKTSTATAPKTTASTAAPAVVAKPAATPSAPSVVEALSDQWSECALLNGTCSVSLPSAVAIGANGYFNYGTFSNSTACTYSVFGNPNATGQVACYKEPTPTASSDVWTQCAAENGTCSYSGVMTIAFGANGDYHYATLGGGGTACTDAVFGDPAYGATKTCYLMAPPPEFTHWNLCATSGGTCKFSGTQEVAYGSNGRYTYGSYTTSTPCTSSALGNPESSGTRYCYVQNYYQY